MTSRKLYNFEDISVAHITDIRIVTI